MGSCVSNIRRPLERVSRLGIKVQAPVFGSRKKPDGTVIKWERATVGQGEPGTTLPFLIEDITPRSYRVQTSASTKGTGLTGVAVVVLGVKDLNASIALFRRVYGLPAPAVQDNPGFGAKLAYFEGTPVMLAAPLVRNSWLSNRLARFGDCPAAFLLGTRDFKATAAHFSLRNATQWFNRKVSWFDTKKLQGVKLGIISR